MKKETTSATLLRSARKMEIKMSTKASAVSSEYETVENTIDFHSAGYHRILQTMVITKSPVL